MAKVALALIYNTIADTATISSTGVNTWSPDLPLGNLQNTLLNKTARAIDLGTGTQTIEFLIDLGAYNPADLSTYKKYDTIALINHSISPKGLISISIGNNPSQLTEVNVQTALSLQSNGTTLNDATGNGSLVSYLNSTELGYATVNDELYKALQSLPDWTWSSPNWFSRRLTELDLYGFTRTYSINLPLIMDNTARGTQAANGRYIKIKLTDTFASSLREYIDIGRLFIGSKFMPAKPDTLRDTTISYSDKSIVTESIGGEHFYDKRSVKRTIDFTFGVLSAPEVYDGILDVQRKVGLTGEVLVIPDITDTIYGFKRNFLGRFTALNPISRLSYNWYSNKISIEEIL